MKIKTGIYKIKNLINNKVYIGSAVNIDRRWSLHQYHLSKNIHHSKKLQNSVNKNGIDNFIFEIIEECESGILIEREQYWIDFLNSYNNGYNSTPKAGSTLGRKHSEKTKHLIGSKSKGRKHSEKTKNKISKINKGRFIGSDNHMFNKKVSEETKRKRELYTYLT